MVEVVSPNGDEAWEVNSTQKIEWNSSAISNIEIELSTDGGSSWSVIAENLTASTGEYSWSIPDNPSLNCLIKISSLSEPVYTDQSDGLFAIIEEPSLQVVSPNGSEDYTVGEEQEITWNSINVDSVRIDYSTNAGSSWLTVVSSTPSNGVYSWTISSTPSENCLVMITDIANPANKDTSDGYFTISPITPDAPVLVSPENEKLDLELPITFEWESVEGAVAYDFQLAYDDAFTNIVHDRDGINSLTTSVNSLIEGMKFYWRIKAIGLDENSPYSETFSFVTNITPPDGLVLTRDSNNPLRVNLNWNDNSNGETGYFIERAELDSSWGLHDLVDANETFWWEAVFKPENYSYRVKAKSDFTESGYSNVVSVIISGVDGEEMPTDYSLAQNYPNPFNPSTQIRFGLPFESNVKLKIFNILGQTVAQLANETMLSGYHILEWNAGNLSSGVYFYTIEANSVNGDKTFNSVKKMILVK